MKILILVAAAAAAFGAAAPAVAAVQISAQDGGAVYAGPTPTFDFETPAPVTGGLVTTGSVAGVRAQPLGSTGNYLTVGPTDGSPALLSLSQFGKIASISLLWGSVDTYNTLQLLSGGLVVASFTGADVTAPANGAQTEPETNPIVRLTLTGAERTSVDGLRFISTSNAFEVDNIAVGVVPEPGTWAMMIGGFGLIGGMLRARRRSGFRAATA